MALTCLLLVCLCHHLLVSWWLILIIIICHHQSLGHLLFLKRAHSLNPWWLCFGNSSDILSMLQCLPGQVISFPLQFWIVFSQVELYLLNLSWFELYLVNLSWFELYLVNLSWFELYLEYCSFVAQFALISAPRIL